MDRVMVLTWYNPTKLVPVPNLALYLRPGLSLVLQLSLNLLQAYVWLAQCN